MMPPSPGLLSGEALAQAVRASYESYRIRTLAHRVVAILRADAKGERIGTYLVPGGNWTAVEITPATRREAREALTPDLIALMDASSYLMAWRRWAGELRLVMPTLVVSEWPDCEACAEPVPAQAAE